MSSITIRNLDDQIKASLRLRAAQHGTSMEQEVRNILKMALATEHDTENGLDLAMRINQRFKDIGGDDLVVPERPEASYLPDFSES